MSIEMLGMTLDKQTISLKEPSTMIITRSWDSPAWQLDITFPHEGSLDDLNRIQVKHDSEGLFAGMCDEIVRSVDGNGAYVSISARTPGALLCDNEALPKTYTDLTAQAFFNTEIKPLGFNTLTLPNTTASAATFQLGKGHSVWEAFCILCFRLYGREPYINANNDIVVEALSPDNPVRVSNDVNDTGALRYCSLEYITRRSSPLSTIVYRDVGGAYSQLYENPFGNSQQVRRNRYIIPAGEYTGRPALDAYRRVMFFYTDKASRIEALDDMADRERYLYCSAGASDDPEWNTYLNLLYPDAAKYYTETNRKNAQLYRKNGDCITAVRRLTLHMAFSLETLVPRFAEEARLRI